VRTGESPEDAYSDDPLYYEKFYFAGIWDFFILIRVCAIGIQICGTMVSVGFEVTQCRESH